MAWGAKRGIDDIVQRCASNDAKLKSLCLLPQRQFGDKEAVALCSALTSNTVLEDLSISSHAISPAAAGAFADLLAANSCITSLSLGNRSFGDEGLAALCPGIRDSRSLNHLNLEAKGLTAAGCTALSEALATNGSIRELVLAQNDVQQEGIAALAPSLLRLRLLDCGSVGLEGEGSWGAIASVLQGGALEALLCGGNVLGEAGASALAPGLAASSLRELSAPSCSLGPAGAGLLALSLPASLAWLDLSQNGLGPAGAAALAGGFSGGAGRGLRQLTLCNNGLDDSSLAELAGALASLPPGLSLDLGGNAVGPAALRSLATCLLATLRLHDCQLGSAGAAQLTALIAGNSSGRGGVEGWDSCAAPAFSGLQELDISANGVPAEGLLGLLQALRDCPAACSTLRLLVLAANDGLDDERVKAAVGELQEAREGLTVVRRAADSGEQSNFPQR